MKWDLILESGTSDLFIKDFHLSPVSDYIPFNYKREENLLNYSHEENIKSFYKENSGFFYENLINPELENNWLATPEVIYNDTVDMGCKRPKNYSIYKKQFEFLVPLWLENINNPLSFIISIAKNGGEVFASKELKLEIKNNYKYHNKFVNYFNNYIHNIGLDTGDDNVINIALKDSYATINGIDLKTGKVRTAQDQNIIYNLLLRERPLMENDNMITQLFENNKMIAKQLFNFNLCFNIEDILSSVIRDQLYGKTLNIKVEAKIGDEKLLIKDFYTNYECIKKIQSSVKDSATYNLQDNPNVLSYMSDNKAIDLIDKNKIKSNIIHWSLTGNNDYIFNLYDGFSSFIKRGDQILSVSHLYNDTPDTNKYEYDDSLNNLSWINYETNFTVDRLNKIYSNYIDFKKQNATCIKPGWIKNLFFKNIDNSNDEVYAYLGIYNLKDYVAIENSYGSVIKNFNNEIKYIIPNNEVEFILFLVEDINQSKMTFKSFSELLKSYKGKVTFINTIKKVLTNLKPVPIVVFNNSLDITKASSPDIVNSDEIEYIKNNNCPITYVARYDGKIKPTFIDNDVKDIQKQNLFYKRIKNEKFEKFNNSGYEPLYPSLKYFSISYDENAKYDTPIYDETYKEYKWFNENKHMLLIPELIFQFTIKSEGDSIEKLNSQIKKTIIEKIINLYNIDEDSANYVYNLYKYDINFDYTIEHGIEGNNIPLYKYNYTINTILK